MPYLCDWRIWRSRCNECNCAGSRIVGHHRFPDIGLHVRDVPQVPDGADALKERATLDETWLSIIYEQGLVHVIRQFLFGGGRAVGQHAAGGGVLLGPRDGCHCKLEIWKRKNVLYVAKLNNALVHFRVFIQIKLAYLQAVTNYWYSVAQMCTREECSPAKIRRLLRWRHESKWAHYKCVSEC